MWFAKEADEKPKLDKIEKRLAIMREHESGIK